MWDTTSRTLELIARLDGRAPQTACMLAAELGVTERTVRRDVARLRDLGYPVDTTRDSEGGYSLEYGAALPPISMTFDEAIVCTLALQSWRDGPDGTLAASALWKLAAALPQKARLVAGAVNSPTRAVSSATMFQSSAHQADAARIGVLARACARNVQIHIGYKARDGQLRERRVEPNLFMNANRCWYLVGYDLDKADWRTFRLDRILELRDTDKTFTERSLPDADMEAWLIRQISTAIRQVTATVRIHLPVESARQFIAPVWGDLTKETSTSCIGTIGSDDYASIACWLILLNANIDVLDSDGLRIAFREVSERAAQASEGPHHE